MISVIVPVYNVEKYLECCINSIINQTYKDLEIILVNDGSTDGSGELCDKLATTDSRIKVIHKDNSGVSETRNLGISIAEGEWITFVDADDFIETDMYEKLINESLDKDVVFCRMKNFYPDNKIEYVFENKLEKLGREPWYVTDMVLGKGVISNGDIVEYEGVFGSPCRSLFKLSIIIENGIKFPLGVKMAEDKLFVMEYLSYCKTARVIDDYLYNYRRDRQGSASTTHIKAYECDYFQIKNRLVEFVRIINNNYKLSLKEKERLIFLEEYSFCFSFVINQILFNKNYREELNKRIDDVFFKTILIRHSKTQLKKFGFSTKKIIITSLIKHKCWRIIKLLLKLK